MAFIKQKVYLNGQIASLDILKQIPSGDEVLNFSMRAPGLVKNGEGDDATWEDEKGFWVDCQIWNHDAKDAARILEIGSKVLVEGCQTVNQFKSKKPETLGHARERINVRVDHVSLKLAGIESVVFKPKKARTDTETPGIPGDETAQPVPQESTA